MSQSLDYKELLKKYMRHLIEREGADFLASIEADIHCGITEEEYNSLCVLADEVDPL